ncbi:MAG TPA: RNA 2',3'-cyclic phosphodiesterase [Candidatus Eisenbacteria bacterium]|nr:RNA 2',3'-cyclic phosphodiesterase [Candidatus Eisenbacteria bacterium]
MTKRLFISLPIPGDDASRFAEYAALCARAYPGARPTATENLHVTARFFGDVDEEDVEPLIGALGPAVSALASFTMPFDGVRTMPPGRDTMIWAVYGGGVAFTALAYTIEAAAKGIVPMEPAKEHVPHVTLVRDRGPMSGTLPPFDGVRPLAVEECALRSSVLGPGGPVYATLARFPLGDSR